MAQTARTHSRTDGSDSDDGSSNSLKSTESMLFAVRNFHDYRCATHNAEISVHCTHTILLFCFNLVHFPPALPTDFKLSLFQPNHLFSGVCVFFPFCLNTSLVSDFFPSSSVCSHLIKITISHYIHFSQRIVRMCIDF